MYALKILTIETSTKHFWFQLLRIVTQKSLDIHQLFAFHVVLSIQAIKCLPDILFSLECAFSFKVLQTNQKRNLNRKNDFMN